MPLRCDARLLCRAVTLLLVALSLCVPAGPAVAGDSDGTASAPPSQPSATPEAEAGEPPAEVPADASQDGTASQAPPAAASPAAPPAAVQPAAPPPGPIRPPVPAALRAEQARQRQREQEIRRLGEEMQSKPADPEPLLKLLDQLFAAHQGGDALEAAERFVVANPSVAGGYLALGRAMFWMGDYDRALLQFQRAVGLDGSHAPALFWLSRVQAALGDRKAAMESLQQYIQRSPDDQPGLVTLAHAQEQSGDLPAAIRTWDKVAGLSAAKGMTDLNATARAKMLKELERGGGLKIEVPAGGVTVPMITPLRRVPGVKARINGGPEKVFLIDLSTTDTVLTPDTARELALKEYGGPSTPPPGQAMGLAAFAVLDPVEIAGLTIRRLPVAINLMLRYAIPEVAGVLGRGVLSRVLLTVNSPDATVTFAPPAREPIDGAPIVTNGALLVDATFGGVKAGKFVVDLTTYTPGPVSVLWVQEFLGTNILTPGVTPVMDSAYVFQFTMPQIEIAGVKWVSYKATAMDLRSPSEKIGTELQGILANSLLAETAATFDLAHHRMRLVRLREQTFRSPTKVPQAPAPDKQGEGGTPPVGEGGAPGRTGEAPGS